MQHPNPDTLDRAVPLTTVAQFGTKKTNLGVQKPREGHPHAHKKWNRSSSADPSFSSSDNEPSYSYSDDEDDDDDARDEEQRSARGQALGYLGSVGTPQQATAPQQLVYNHFNEPPRASGNPARFQGRYNFGIDAERGPQLVTPKNELAPMSSHLWSRRAQELTTNIDDEDDDDGGLRNDLVDPVRHVTSASSGFRSEESPASKKKKKKSRSNKESSERRGRGHGDGTLDAGSSDGYYSKIKDNGPPLIPNIPPPPPDGTPNVPPPRKVKGVVMVQTPPSLAASQTLERSRATNKRGAAGVASVATNATVAGPSLDHYIQQQQQQQVIPTFPRTVPRTVSFPRDTQGRLSTADGHSQQHGVLANQQLGLLGNQQQHHGVLGNNSTGMTFEPQQQQQQQFSSRVFPVVTYQCRTKSPDTPPSDRMNRQTKDADDDFSKYIDHTQSTQLPPNHPQAFTTQPLPPPPTSANFNNRTRFGSASYQVTKVKKHLTCKKTWKCAALVLACMAAVLMAIIAYFITIKIYNSTDSSLRTTVQEDTTSTDFLSNDNDLLFGLPRGSTSYLSASNHEVYTYGKTFSRLVEGGAFLRLSLVQPESQPVKFNVTIPKGQYLGVYGRRGAPPSHVLYDFFRVIDGDQVYLNERFPEMGGKSFHKKSSMAYSIKDSVFLEYLEKGTWYLALYNDSPNNLLISLYAVWQDKPTGKCPFNCHGRGECVGQKCTCFPGYTGTSCNDSLCPALCMGNGLYQGGRCKCFKGWTGLECQKPITACVDGGCGLKGRCINGECICAPGYSGMDCSEEVCQEECVNGYCEDRSCFCQEGWTGERCDQLPCSDRCHLHGNCNNGTCICKPGWNGRHCTLDGCPKDCSNHGSCKQVDGKIWTCICSLNWKGEACDLPVEIQCGNNLDDDGDGLTDCHDSECCLTRECQENNFCKTVPNPIEILLRSNGPVSTAPFFDRVRFLIGDKSVQSYATSSIFNHSQVSVIRGKVLTPDGSPVIGVRIGVDGQPQFGHTLTRERGLFDIVVNGGGSVTLDLQRMPFNSKRVTVMVPWNRMIIIDDIELRPSDVISVPQSPYPGYFNGEMVKCPHIMHDYVSLKPIIYSSSKHSHLVVECSDTSGIFPETQMVQETIKIPHTDTHLVYQSSDAVDYMATVMILLTGPEIPAQLTSVHLTVKVEGIVFKKVFEGNANLKYRFAWNRRNAYNEKVYGVVRVTVSVGYEYEDCDQIFWTTQLTTMNGYSLSPASIGGWRLNIHHTYNFQEGTVYKGDGGIIRLRERPLEIKTILGDRRQRKADCRGCDGKTEDNRLMAPVDLASGRDGSLFVGDYNFIRKLSANREEITSILQLSMPEVPYKYFMTVSPVDGQLYLSDHRNYRIIKVRSQDQVKDIMTNFDPVAGTGEQCIPGDRERCGDNGPAVNAKLFYPKGIAINKDGMIYIADGSNIRLVDTTGTIRTIIGSQAPPKHWDPFPCGKISFASNVMLQWPLSLAINPVDDTLHILDYNVILKLTSDGRVYLVAGHLSHCPMKNSTSSNHRFKVSHHFNDRLTHSHHQQKEEKEDLVKNGRKMTAEQRRRPTTVDVFHEWRTEADSPLDHPHHIAISPDGEIYVVENDGKRTNRIIMIDTSGRLHRIAGASSDHCDCRLDDCRCFDSKATTASKALLDTPTSVAVTPDGVVHVADMANLQVRSIFHRLPIPDRSGQVSVTDSDLTYIFNRYGQHVSTASTSTERPVYTFTPDIISSLGKLVKVVDTQGNQMELKKELCNKEICHMEIVVSGRHKNKLIFNAMGQLYAFVCQEDNYTRRFYYSAATELLHSAESSDGTTRLFEYNAIGRLASFVLPTGVRKTLRTDLVSGDLSAGHGGVLVEVINERGVVEDGYLFAQDRLSIFSGGKFFRTVEQRSDKDEVSLKLPRGTTLTLTTESQGRDRYVRRVVELPDNRTFDSEWHLTTRQDSGQRNIKKLKLGGETALQLEFDHSSQTETVFNRNQDRIIHLQFDRYGRVVQIQPAGPLEGLNISYNSLTNRLASWTRGDLGLVHIYDEKYGLLLESQAGNKVYRRYTYEGGNKPTEVTLPSGKQFQLRYDDIGNLRGVVTPSLSHHAFHSLHSFTLYRQILRPSTVATGVYSRNFDSNGRPLSVSYPSNHKRLTYHYSRHGNRVSVFVDWTDQVYDFDPHFKGLLRWANLTDRVKPGYHCAIGYSSRDALVTSHVLIQWGSTINSLTNATYFYSYDNRARLSHTDVILGDRPVRRYAAVERSDDTGAVTRLHSFSIDQPGPHRQTLRDLNVEIAREFDRLGRLSDVWYRFNTHSIYHLEAKYDQTTGRLLQWRRKVGSSDTKVYDNLYDSDGNLVEVLLSGQLAWKYDYDAAGNIVRVTYYGTSHNIVYNNREQVESSGSKSYTFDNDGFLSQRDRENFEFDSFGRLKRASKSGEYDVRYYFDARHRLVARHELLLDDVVQFFYADLENPTRVTHTLENNNYGRAHASSIGAGKRSGREGDASQSSATLQLSEFYYDDRGELFAIRRGDNDHYYVANDVHGSPVVVLNGLGRVMKQLEHDPLGLRKWDSVRNFSLHIGYRGGLHDPFTGFVLFEAGAKVYDPEVGRWAVPDYARFLDNYQYLPRQPEYWSNLYAGKFRDEGNDLSTLDTDEDSLSDITKWLSQLGYDYAGIITPSSRFTQAWAFQLPRGISAIVGNNGFQFCDENHKSSACQKDCSHRSLLLRTALDCAFDRELNRFTSLLSSTSSKLSPPPISNKFDNLGLSPLPPLLGRGIMITTEDPVLGSHAGMVGVTTLKPAHEALSLLASTLLNDSILVLPRYNVHSIDVHHFIKTSLQQAEDDILELALRPEGTIQGLNVSVHRSTDSSHVEIRLRGNHTVFYLRYGVDMTEEREHVLKHAKSRALEGAWAIEKELAQTGKLSVNEWTRVQREELLVKGRVEEFQARYIRNIAIYTELADDPKNVAFVHAKTGRDDKD